MHQRGRTVWLPVPDQGFQVPDRRVVHQPGQFFQCGRGPGRIIELARGAVTDGGPDRSTVRTHALLAGAGGSGKRRVRAAATNLVAALAVGWHVPRWAVLAQLTRAAD